MKIAYISGSYLPSRQANSIHVMRMTSAMARLGHDVTLYARESSTGESSKGESMNELAGHYGVAANVRIMRLPVARAVYGRELSYAWRLRKLVSRDRPDLVYGRHLAGLMATVGMGPTIYEVHSLRAGINPWMERLLLRHRNLKAVVAITAALAGDFSRRHHPRAPVLIEPDAVDPTTYELIQPMTLSGTGRLRIGYCGHLYPGRGGELLVEIARRRPDYDLHLVGGEPRDIARLTERTQGLTNLYFHGFVAPQQVPAYLSAMDVLAAPYQTRVEAAGRENTVRWMSPMKLFEYLDAGKPIVISDLPAITEVVVHDETALLTPPDSVDAWCAAIDRLQDGELRARLGRNGQEFVRRRFTWEQRAQRVLRLAERPEPLVP